MTFGSLSFLIHGKKYLWQKVPLVNETPLNYTLVTNSLSHSLLRALYQFNSFTDARGV